APVICPHPGAFVPWLQAGERGIGEPCSRRRRKQPGQDPHARHRRAAFLVGCGEGLGEGDALGAGLGTAPGRTPYAVGLALCVSIWLSAWATTICPIVVSALSTVVSVTPALPLLTASTALRGPVPVSGPVRTAPLLASCRSLASEISAMLNCPLSVAAGTVVGTTTTASVAWLVSDEPPLGPLTCRNPALASPVMTP